MASIFSRMLRVSILCFYLTILLLPKCSGDLKYGPCLPARDWGSCESGLGFAICVMTLSSTLTFVPHSLFHLNEAKGKTQKACLSVSLAVCLVCLVCPYVCISFANTLVSLPSR